MPALRNRSATSSGTPRSLRARRKRPRSARRCDVRANVATMLPQTSDRTDRSNYLCALSGPEWSQTEPPDLELLAIERYSKVG
jgi:hypothetical protein